MAQQITLSPVIDQPATTHLDGLERPAMPVRANRGTEPVASPADQQPVKAHPGPAREKRFAAQHDALPRAARPAQNMAPGASLVACRTTGQDIHPSPDRKSTRLNSSHV